MLHVNQTCVKATKVYNLQHVPCIFMQLSTVMFSDQTVGHFDNYHVPDS